MVALGSGPLAAQAAEPDWITISAPGNAPYTGPFPFGGEIMNGRGSVGYDYRIARTEISTGNWLEFVNTFSTQGDFPQELFGTPSFIWGPSNWGAGPDGSYSGPGFRHRLSDQPQAADRPVNGIGWRHAAIYCNWLHNGKQATLASLMTGAYDASTFGQFIGPDGRLMVSDNTARLDGARYFMPTLDEWSKAVYYDPHRYGQDQGGWWLYPNGSDSPPVPGPPGAGGGETSAGYLIPGDPFGAWDIPLGAYTGSLSPWGLLDTSGGVIEWTESPQFPGNSEEPMLAGGTFAGDENYIVGDHITGTSGLGLIGGASAGIRLASPVPSPGTVAFCVVLLGSALRRRERN